MPALAIWALVLACAAIVVGLLYVYGRARVDDLFDEPLFRTADGSLIERQTRALQAQDARSL